NLLYSLKVVFVSARARLGRHLLNHQKLMANKKNQYSSEFKSEVALKALARDKKNLEPLSKRYKVPVSLILVWATQLEENPAGIDEGSEELPVEQDEPAPIDLEIKGNETINSFKQGVMGDNLNYKRLIAWTVIGLILVTIFVQMLIEIFGIGNGRRPQQIGGEHA